MTSTHPPITERIRILRSIGRSADFTAYQNAFKEVSGKETNIIPQAELKASKPIDIRGATGLPFIGETKKQAQRNVGDLVMQLNDYSFINCQCGVKLKVPPGYKNKNVVCPRCKRQHKV